MKASTGSVRSPVREASVTVASSAIRQGIVSPIGDALREIAGDRAEVADLARADAPDQRRRTRENAGRDGAGLPYR